VIVFCWSTAVKEMLEKTEALIWIVAAKSNSPKTLNGREIFLKYFTNKILLEGFFTIDLRF